jgi:hypothetical protein
MARPALDLPDPMNDSGSGAIHSADDLLAQLAGEEIDRLLSEADDDDGSTAEPPATRPQNVDRPAPAPTAVVAPVAPTAPSPKVATASPKASTPIDDAVLDATEEALDDLFRELDEEDGPTPHSAPAPAPFSGTPVEPRVPPATAPKPPAPSPEKVAAAVLANPPSPTPAPVAIAPVAQPPSAADDLAAELEADEAAHAAAVKRMKQPAAAATVAAVPANIDAAPAEVDESEVVYERIPLLVRVLEWVNAPLGFLSVDAREAVGKIALVTTVNAIAILTYVLLFRRP